MRIFFINSEEWVKMEYYFTDNVVWSGDVYGQRDNEGSGNVNLTYVFKGYKMWKS